MSHKIGLLLPRSVIYPTINFDMVGGLRCGLADLGIGDVEIRTENVGIGADPKIVYAACEKLVMDGCMVVAGYVNPESAETVAPLMAGAGGIFIALDAGYQFPFYKHTLRHVFTVSLQGTLCCRVTAAMACAEGKRKFANLTSFYEAGYRSSLAFGRAREEGGGEVTFNLITPLKRAEFTLAPLIAHLQEGMADAILASFCGDMLQDFCMAAAAAGPVFEGVTVYGAPMMGDEIWLAQCPYPGLDYKICVSWASGLDNDANRHYKQVMAEKKQRVNIWSELAWEAARLVATALLTDADAGIAAIEEMTFQGPRGNMRVDAATHQVCAPVYEAVVKRDGATGNCAIEILQESPITEEQRAALTEDIQNFDGLATSWKNAYGCLDS
jgi:branched-chain amino acid transport system substrate-binding protein